MGRGKANAPRRRLGVQFEEALVGAASSTASSDASEHADTSISAAISASTAPSLRTSTERSTRSPAMSAMPIDAAMSTSPPLARLSAVTASVDCRVSIALPKPGEATTETNAAYLQATDAETITISVRALEQWKQRTILEIEDHFSNEQLKRIAEFGRVHANLVKEAKEYVFALETRLHAQFEQERIALQAQAEAYVAQYTAENARLTQQVDELRAEIERLSAQPPSQCDEADRNDAHAAGQDTDGTTSNDDTSMMDEELDGENASGNDGGDEDRASKRIAHHKRDDDARRIEDPGDASEADPGYASEAHPVDTMA